MLLHSGYQNNDTQHKNKNGTLSMTTTTSIECDAGDCHDAVSNLLYVMLLVIIQNVVMLSVVMLRGYNITQKY
jgi:hypothetical protein